ncbi:TPA: hypothetical protein ACH3X2_010455 [Trebouxia sp. C0005]|nr:MAG: hypothetical protein FRX49_04873 [Trebouxia sp. A1-2]
MLADAAKSSCHSMTALEEPCKAFGDFVEDVQHCTDPGTGLQQLSTKGLTSLLAMRDIGYKMFGVTEGVKADAAKARDAFDEKTLVLQNLLYESGYYQKEIQEARDYKSAVSNADMELMSVEKFQQTADTAFTANLEAPSDSYEHKLMLKRLDHELHSRKQARQQLSELKARKDALQTNLGQKRKALTDLHKHAKHIKSSTQNVRKLLSLPDHNDQSQHQLAQLLPLPLYFIYSQASAILDTLSTLVRTEVVGSKEGAEVELAGDNKNALQPARKKQKRSASFVSTSDHDHYQAFPLAVKLHLLDLSHTITFTYLPSLGVVTAEAGDQPGNELLAALFKDDSGKDTPNTANKHLDDGSFVFDTKTTARPYRWAQWLAGLDFLPAIPAGLLVQGNVCQETLQDAVKSYSRERRAIHILTTLVKQAEDASELGQQLSELGKKRIPLHFPTRLFRHAPEASLQVWQEMPKQAWPASVAAVKPRPPSSASKPEVNVQDAEEDEEGELADAPQASTDNVKAEEDAMEIDPDSAGQNGFREGSGQGQVPEPLTQADGEGHISWGKAAPGSTFTMYKMMIKSSNGWQLDGHVQIYSSYPAVAPQVVVTAIKEGYLPARHVKAGRPQRQELSHQEVTAVQEQVNRDLLSKLIEDEQSHVLSYQMTQLLVSLVEHTRSKAPLSAAAALPAAAASAVASEGAVI